MMVPGVARVFLGNLHPVDDPDGEICQIPHEIEDILHIPMDIP